MSQTQPTPEQTITALQEQNSKLKVRIFDAEEAVRGEQEFKNQMFTALFQAMGVAQEDANNPQAYVDLATKLKADSVKLEALEATGEETKEA